MDLFVQISISDWSGKLNDLTQLNKWNPIVLCLLYCQRQSYTIQLAKKDYRLCGTRVHCVPYVVVIYNTNITIEMEEF